MIKNIENIFKLNDNSVEFSNRKIYENKNIIDRFILECINHGISPKLNLIIPSPQHNSNTQSNMQGNTQGDNYVFPDVMDNDLEYIEQLSTNLFFNKCLNNVEELRKCVYFRKMLDEYNEKKIKLTNERVLRLEKVILDAQLKFIGMNRMLILNKNKPGYFNNIDCSIYVSGELNYLIKYKKYTKVINFFRYSRIIRNYDRPFPYDIIRMILRYAIFDTSNQQWSIGINLYEYISNIFDISFEMFASPLNFNMNMFCSIFLDTDKIFGSVGSFYNLSLERLLNQNIKGVFFNPPYLPILMNYTTKICINLLEKMERENMDFTIISFLPNWADADYIQLFLQSKYLVANKIIPKGDYILHEKDKGKLIKGTFELLVIMMNSRINHMLQERKEYFISNFKNIISIMKDETQIANSEK
jgi:hypothetical protein